MTIKNYSTSFQTGETSLNHRQRPCPISDDEGTPMACLNIRLPVYGQGHRPAWLPKGIERQRYCQSYVHHSPGSRLISTSPRNRSPLDRKSAQPQKGKDVSSIPITFEPGIPTRRNGSLDEFPYPSKYGYRRTVKNRIETI